MAKKCPTCGNVNDDSRIFCSACGDPLDADLRLIQDLEKRKHQAAQTVKAPTKKFEDEDVVIPRREKKSLSPILVVLLGVVIAAIMAVIIYYI